MKALLRLGTFIRPYVKQVVLSSIMLLILMGIDLVFPVIIQKVIDVGLVAGQQQFLITATLILIGLGLVKAGGSFVQRYQVNYIAQHISYDLRNKLFNHIQHLPFTFHDHVQSGQLISRAIEDVRSIQNFTSGGLIELIREALLTVGITFVLFTSNAKLAFISLLPLIPLVIWTTNFGKRISKLFLKVNNILGDLSSQLQENVTGVQVVRAFAREDHEVERFNKINRTLYDGQVTVVKERSQNMATTTFLITFGTLLILWFGGQMVLNHQLSLGELVAFNSYMLLLATPAQQLGWLVNAGGEAAAGVQRTMEILDHRPEIQSPPDAPVLSHLQGRVEFDHVSFKYAGETSTALEDIHVVIEPNQVVALIGPTGSGKTSLVNLIPRFYDVCQGSVRVDGQDIRQVDLVSLRQQIGIVLQSSLLFSASIRENIAYGHPDASEAEIVAAAKAAQAHDFIVQLPNGYDTVVGERGEPPVPDQPLSAEELSRLFGVMERMYLPRAVSRYISRLVAASHPGSPEATADVSTYVTYGASPRAAIAMAEASRAYALLNGRPSVGFEDVRAVAQAVMNHRLILNYKARFDQVGEMAIVQGLLDTLDEAGLGLPADVEIAKSAGVAQA